MATKTTAGRVAKSDLIQVEPLVYEVPASYREDMRVPARVYADEYILDMAAEDNSLEQLVNTATLPGVVRYTLAMPDVHQGYGFPIGGVAAMSLSDGVISPGGVGYDINCGVRLLRSSIEAEALRPYMDDLMTALYQNVPSGVGASRAGKLSAKELAEVLEQGANWAVRQGLGRQEDVEHTESQGRMEEADASAVSQRAKDRGADQVGTLGSGNHFLEVDVVTEVFDEEIANAYGLFPGQVCVWIHCGSRGLGHQVCTDAVRTMQQVAPKYNITLPDRELACAPFSSQEGQEYFRAMSAAANFAWANRQVITHQVREAFKQVLGSHFSDCDLHMVYDVCHNIAKIERHQIDGQEMRLCVHRKGATRAFGPGQPDVPQTYREVGQPVLIPGDMGTGSFVLAGTARAMKISFGSSCHGAGRVMSRSKSRKNVTGQQLRQQLEQRHIVVRAGSMRGLAEEAPDAYKDLDRVVNVVHDTGMARKVARTRPMGVIKG
ncbi:MAG: RtcB family protein [Chloroflexi bacterium]|jgi:tRNA-splicing ligase RtcB|nr:RtcB family protein [Chloroflexota bacterium]